MSGATTDALLAANPFPGLRAFRPTEADRFFGGPPPAGLADLCLVLRPPRDCRAAFVARHADILSRI